MTQPLAGLKVVELAEGIAGPYAGKLLADFGADVVKVEPPGGDRSRQLGPFPTTGPNPEQSALFLHLNTNKRSVVATGDGGDGGDGDELLGRLLGWADIVLQSSPEPDPAELKARYPGLVVVTVTSFGLTGPCAGYKGEEIVHLAYGGPMSASGNPDREPVKMGGAVGQYQCGTVAATAALAAVMLAQRDGAGVHIDLANVETQVGSIDRRMTYLLYGAYRGENVPRAGGYSAALLPNGCRPAADGHVQISTLMNWIPRMLSVLGDDDYAAQFNDPMWLFNEAMPDLGDAATLTWSVTHTRAEAMAEAQSAGWPVTAVHRPVEILTDHHFQQRGFFVPTDHPVAGEVQQPGAPVRLADGWALHRPAPTLGQHTAEIRAELDLPDAEPGDEPATDPAPAPTTGTSPAEADGSGRALPLAGVRILDLTVVWAGPYTTTILGDLGAEIIRVDNPYVFPSATRGVLPRPTPEMVAEIGGIFGGYPDADPGERPWNRTALFNAHARNKRSITLDLRRPEGTEALLKLAEQCDIVIENNSVDLLDKLGVGWEALQARNPNLTMIRMPSVGLDGPYRNFIGFGVNFEALCGLGAIRGYADADLSENDSVFHMDAATGSAGAFATLMALRRRERTGTAELIELSQAENMLNHIGELLIEAQWTGVEHSPLGNRHPSRAPQGCYPCQGDDAWVVISVGDDGEWAGLGTAAGNPDWSSDPRFATAAGRHEHHGDLDEAIADWTSGLTSREVFERCQAQGVPAAPVLHELEAMSDPHLNARAMFATNGNDDTGDYPHPAHLWHWDGPELRWDRLPVLGADNESVLKDIAGLSDDEYAELNADGHLTGNYLAPDGSSL